MLSFKLQREAWESIGLVTTLTLPLNALGHKSPKLHFLTGKMGTEVQHLLNEVQPYIYNIRDGAHVKFQELMVSLLLKD